jgi:uncharacterized membrane protein
MQGSALSDRWVWIIILSVFAVIVIPLVTVWFILQLSPELKIVATFLIIVLWGVAAGYKDWVKTKREEEEKKLQRTEGT